MEYEQKDMDGVAFKNDKKSEDWHADWNGSAMIEGTMYWVNMYDNVSKNGKDYRKIRFKPQNGASLDRVLRSLVLLHHPRRMMTSRGSHIQRRERVSTHLRCSNAQL